MLRRQHGVEWTGPDPIRGSLPSSSSPMFMLTLEVTTSSLSARESVHEHEETLGVSFSP